jgi:hypothetical protein
LTAPIEPAFHPLWGRDLREQGSRNIAAGATLMALGVAGVLGGAIMTGLATDCGAVSAYGYSGSYYGQSGCGSTNNGLLAAGVVTGLIGAGMFVGGVAARVVGRTQLRQASWSFAPALARRANGAGLPFTF